jgi:uncharacterized protein (DUF305 family)
MSITMKTALAGVTLSGLLMACTPAADTEPAATSNTEMIANSGMSGGMASEQMSGPPTPFTPSEDKMHRDMMQATGADVQETYARKMVAHHRGAVEMSEVVLRENPDAELRAMAEKTIADQTREIAMLEDWIAKRPATGGASSAPAEKAE